MKDNHEEISSISKNKDLQFSSSLDFQRHVGGKKTKKTAASGLPMTAASAVFQC